MVQGRKKYKVDKVRDLKDQLIPLVVLYFNCSALNVIR